MTTLTKLIELQAAAKTHANNVPNLSGMDSFEDAAYSFDFTALDAKIKRYEDALRHCLGALTGGMDGIWDGNVDAANEARKALEGML